MGAHSRGPIGRSRAITGVEMGDGDEDAIRSDGDATAFLQGEAVSKHAADSV